MFELTILSADLLSINIYFHDLTSNFFSLVYLIDDFLPAAFEVIDGLVQFFLCLLFFLFQPIDLRLKELIIVHGVLQLLSCFSQFLKQMHFFLLERLDDLIEFLVIGLGELVEHATNSFDRFLSDDVDDVFVILIFIEEEVFEFIEDDDAVLLIGQTHLLYLLFTKHIFKEIAFALHATLPLLLQGLVPHLHPHEIQN